MMLLVIGSLTGLRDCYTYMSVMNNPSIWTPSILTGFSGSFILAFSSERKFLVLGQDNRFIVLRFGTFGLTEERGPSSSSFSTAATPARSPKFAFEVLGTSYFLIGTQVAGVGICKIDVTASSNSGLVQQGFGGASATQVVHVISYLTPDLFVSGNSLVLRSLASGTALMPVSAFTATKTVSGLGSSRFIGFCNSQLRTRVYSASSSPSTEITVQTELALLNDLTVLDLAVLPRMSLAVVCYATVCKGIHFETAVEVWSELLSAYSTGSTVLLHSIPATNHLLAASTSGDFQVLQQVAVNAKPALVTQDSSLGSQNVACTAFPDGEYVALLTNAGARVYRRGANCSTACETCLFSNDNHCLSCTSGRMLSTTVVPQTCVTYSCEATCATCTGPLSTQCLTCYPDRLINSSTSTCDLPVAPSTDPNAAGGGGGGTGGTDTGGSGTGGSSGAGSGSTGGTGSTSPDPPNTGGSTAPPQTQTDPSPETPPAAATCFESLTVVDRSTGLCIDCFEHHIFSASKPSCSGDARLHYVDWTASLSRADNGSSSLILTITPDLTHESTPTTQLALFDQDTFERFEVAHTAIASVAFLRTNQLLLTLKRQPSSEESFTVSSSHLKQRSLLPLDSTVSLLLLHKVVQVRVAQPPAGQGELAPGLLSAGRSVTAASRIAVGTAAGAFLASAACSVNLGPAFIKLFQIIEILGKFYFTPTDFSALLDFFLQKVFGLSDLLDVSRDVLLREQRQPNPHLGKLSTLRQERQLLRANPIFVLMYPPLSAVAKLLFLLFGRTREGRTAFRLFLTVKDFVFEASFVDFLFYSCFALVGPWSLQHWSAAFIANKLLGLFLLHACTLHLAETFSLALRRPAKSALAAEDRQKLELVEEGLAAAKTRSVSARLANVVFVFRMVAFQVLLVCLQNAPGLCVGLLVAVQTVCLVQAGFVVLQVRPFDSWVTAVQKSSFEVCVSMFLVSVALRRVGYHHVYSDYAVILLTFLCILVQAVCALRLALLAAVAFLRKVFRKSSKTAASSADRQKATQPDLNRRRISMAVPKVRIEKLTLQQPQLAGLSQGLLSAVLKRDAPATLAKGQPSSKEASHKACLPLLKPAKLTPSQKRVSFRLPVLESLQREAAQEEAMHLKKSALQSATTSTHRTADPQASKPQRSSFSTAADPLVMGGLLRPLANNRVFAAVAHPTPEMPPLQLSTKALSSGGDLGASRTPQSLASHPQQSVKVDWTSQPDLSLDAVPKPATGSSTQNKKNSIRRKLKVYV